MTLPALDFPAPVTCVVQTTQGIFAAAGNRIYRLHHVIELPASRAAMASERFYWQAMTFVSDPEPQA